MNTINPTPGEAAHLQRRPFRTSNGEVRIDFDRTYNSSR